MKWSFKIGRLWGIDVYLHLTFLLLLAWVGFDDVSRTGSLARGVGGVLLYVSLFACVLLHEFGHALAARYFGIPTRDITLLPIGGVARLERLPSNPRHELVIAIAGPLVNVVLGGALAAFLVLSGHSLIPERDFGVISVLQRMFLVNVSLVVFNMLPAFPMDGGRVLRALLAMIMHPVRATRIAANVGRAMAVVFAGVALWQEIYILFFIAVFVWLAAGGEARAMEMQASAAGLVVGQGMRTRFHVVAPGDIIGRVAGLSGSECQLGFPVVDGGKLAGMLMEGDVMDALGRTGPATPVAEVMRTGFPVFNAEDPLIPALRRLAEERVMAAPVLWRNRLVGVLVTEDSGSGRTDRPMRSRSETPPVILSPPG